MINYKEDLILSEFINERNDLNEFLSTRTVLKIGSLGPKGTTTYNATEYLVAYLKTLKNNIDFQICLWNNFKDIQTALINKEVDLIVIPNPFENITEIYWDKSLELAFCFVLESPHYGLAVDDKNTLIKNHYKVATGPAVNHLIEKFINEDLDGKSYELHYVNSTTEAAMAVKEGQADIAMTNKISANKFGLDFVTSTYNAKILWSIFRNKQ